MNQDQQLREALSRLLNSDPTGTIANSTDDELRIAVNDEGADPVVREQAAAILQARAALTATQQAAPEYMHPVAILTKEVKPEHWEPQQAALIKEAGRVAFEKWLRSHWGQGYGCIKLPDGKYRDSGAQSLWECWQAAALLQASTQREQPWVGLTDEESTKLVVESSGWNNPTSGFFNVARAIEAKLREKNVSQQEQPAAMPPLKKDDIEFVLKNFSKRISDLQQEVESGCIGLKIGIEKLHDRLLPNAPSLNESEAFEQSKVPDRIIEQPAASKPEPQAQAGALEIVAWIAQYKDALGRPQKLFLPELPVEGSALLKHGAKVSPLITLQAHREAMK